MTLERDNGAHLYTLEKANSALPLVRAIAKDWVRLSRELEGRKQQIASWIEGREIRGGDPYSEELKEVHSQLQSADVKLDEYVAELRDLDIEPRSGMLGTVDFPTLLDGRIVSLCWRIDESELMHWHEPGQSCQQRRLLAVESASGSETDDARRL